MLGLTSVDVWDSLTLEKLSSLQPIKSDSLIDPIEEDLLIHQMDMLLLVMIVPVIQLPSGMYRQVEWLKTL